MSNAFIEYFEERGEKRGEKRTKDTIVRNLISLGLSTQEIAKATYLSHDLIDEIRESVQAEAV